MSQLYAESTNIVYELKGKIGQLLAGLNKAQDNFKLFGYTPNDMIVFEVIEPHFKEIEKKVKEINDIAKKHNYKVQDQVGTKMPVCSQSSTLGLINPVYEKQNILLDEKDRIIAILSPSFVEITSDVSLGKDLMRDLEILYS